MTAGFDPQDYWQKRLEAHYDLQGVGYLRLGRAYNTWLYRVRRRVFLRAIRELDLELPHLVVLDVGSGTGFYIERWLELGVRDVTGLDLTQAAVAALRGAYPQLEFLQADISQGLGQEQTGCYDVISAMDILFHIVDDNRYRQAVQQLADCLKDGGSLVFSENFLHGPRQGGEHQVSRRLDEITASLAQAGLEIVSRRPMFYWMNAPLDSRNPLRTFFWKVLAWLVARGEAAGFLAGVLLYLPELAMLSLVKEGPSTEIMVCRKSGNPSERKKGLA